MIRCAFRFLINGSVFGKRDLLAFFHVMKYNGTCLYKFDCRETTLSNAVNHFKIFLIEFEICLYKHLYFFTLGISYSKLLSLCLCFGNLNLTYFIQKIVFQMYKTSKSAITFNRGACSTHCLQYW